MIIGILLVGALRASRDSRNKNQLFERTGKLTSGGPKITQKGFFEDMYTYNQ